MSYKYDLVDWTTFCDNLLTTFDLDPIYVILTQADLPDNVLKRWLLAYWCYYSSGPSSYIAEHSDFYEAMYHGFCGADQYPRGHERRHFRGNAGLEAIEFLEAYGPPEKVVDYIYEGGPLDFQSVANRAMKFKLFGPWIAWKIADMGERIMCYPIDFSNANLNMYKDPVQGCALYLYGDWQHPITSEEVNWVVGDMLSRLKDYKAPPFLDRPLNVAECETCACKYKAHIKGHYPINFDTHEITDTLKSGKWGDLAQELLRHMPDGIRNYQ